MTEKWYKTSIAENGEVKSEPVGPELIYADEMGFWPEDARWAGKRMATPKELAELRLGQGNTHKEDHEWQARTFAALRKAEKEAKYFFFPNAMAHGAHNEKITRLVAHKIGWDRLGPNMRRTYFEKRWNEGVVTRFFE